VRRRNGGGLGLAREPDRRRALRQADELLAGDDLLDLAQALAIERQDVLRRYRLALELAQALAIVAAGEPRHRFAHLGERRRAERDRLLGRDVDADVHQAVGVELARQLWRGPRARQDGASHPLA